MPLESAAARSAPLAPPQPGAAGRLGQLLEAQQQLRAGRAELAARSARWLLKADPDHADAHNLLSAALARLGQAAAAERHSRRAAELRPHDPAPLAHLAERLRAQGRLEDAIACISVRVRCPPPAAGDANLSSQRSRRRRALACHGMRASP
jgi:Flp pilus assembly protein TadD